MGLATGALIASLGVWAFNAWRHVSDDDRLMSALTDHCLPYVLTGAAPFEGIGRAAGVYDNLDRDDRIEAGSAKIIFDARFIATWGEITSPPLRICRVDGRVVGASRHAFAVAPDGFVGRITQIVQSLGDMRPDAERVAGAGDADGVFQTLGWFQADKARDRGNRVVMSVVQSQVSSMIVVRDLAQ